jgi:hypothetical protein
MNFIAYSDESYLTGRYKSIATFSFPEKAHSHIRSELFSILKDSDVTEFKWHKLKNAKYRLCALKLIDAVIGFLGRYDVRIDVLIWDTQDSRHRVLGRDDTANFERMFFHLHSQALKRRPREAGWKIYPDRRLEIDWETVSLCLQAVGKRVEVIDLPLLDSFFADSYYQIHEFSEVESHEHPCCQIADLFAGLAVFSKTHYLPFKEWTRKNIPSLRLFQENDPVISNREVNRFDVLKYLNQCCKSEKLGVSLNTFGCLCTRNPSYPINFWHYVPQHEQDKAPSKLEIRKGGD